MKQNFKVEQVNPNDDEYQLTELLVENFSKVNEGDSILTVEGQKSSIDVESEKSGYFYSLKSVGEFFGVDNDVYIISDSLEELDSKENTSNNTEDLTKQTNKSEKKQEICETLKFRSTNGKIRLGILFAGKSFNQVEDALSESNSFEITAIFDDSHINDYRYQGSLDIDNILSKKSSLNIDAFFIATGNKFLRAKYYNLLKTNDLKLTNIFHPTCTISSTAVIGDNVYLGPNVVVSSKAYINSCCFISAMSNVEHHCRIGSNSLLGPGVSLSGSVSIGENTIISAGVAVESNISIGKNVFISSGQGICRHIKNDERV